eukprot:RCo045536
MYPSENPADYSLESQGTRASPPPHCFTRDAQDRIWTSNYVMLIVVGKKLSKSTFSNPGTQAELPTASKTSTYQFFLGLFEALLGHAGLAKRAALSLSLSLFDGRPAVSQKLM